MVVIVALLLGAVIGALRARKRGGNRLDIVQYAAVHAIAFGLVALFASIFINRELIGGIDTTPLPN